MNKKFLSAVLFGALMVTSTGTFVSCKDYDDDIDQINNTLTDLKSKLDALQTKVESGKYVTNVAKDGEGIVITWNDNSTSKIETIKGDKGDAVEIKIDPVSKNWIIDDVDTGICAEGKNGNAAVAAKSPSIDPTTGNWVIYEWNEEKQEYVGTDTGVSAKGASSYVIEEDNYYILHVATSETGEKYTEVKLPKSPVVITELEVLGQVYSNWDGSVNLNSWGNQKMYYSVKIVDDAIMNDKDTKEWNEEKAGKVLKKGLALSTLSNCDLMIRVAPATLDASQFSFKMVNSKLNEAPFTLGTPEVFNGILTSRSTVSGNGLWTVPVSAKENEVYEDVAEYKEQFTHLGSKVAFALQEADGFTTSYNLQFEYAEVTMDAKPAKINNTPIANPTKVATGETLTVVFDYPEYVYDAHLHIDDATQLRWGITDIDGLSFKVGKLADNITTTSFPVTVHYVTLEGDVKKETINIQPAKTLAGMTELASQNIEIVAKAADNKATYSLDPMFTELGADATVLWKADVHHSLSPVFYDDEKGNQVAVSDVTVDFNKTTLKDITEVNIKLGNTRLALDKNYYAIVSFYDENNETLNSVKVPFTVSIPALSKFLVKEQVVFGGTTIGKAYMNVDDQNETTYGVNSNGTSRYAFHHAFNAFDKAFENGSSITFDIDPEQKIGDVKIKDNYAKIVKSNNDKVAIELIDNKKAYHTPINIVITAAKYLGYYDYSKEELAANAFALDVMSPIKEGSVDPATGTAISVVATAEGTAKLTESNFKAATYAGVAYHIFKDAKFGNDGYATEYASKYIKTVEFESANVNVFTVAKEGTAAFKDKNGVTEGYVVITPKNAGYEATEKVNVTVTDIWGYALEAPVNVTVKPHN